MRVLVKGAWGFTSTNRITRAELDRALEASYRMARSLSSVASKPVTLARIKAAKGRYSISPVIDPEDIDIGQKRDLAVEMDKAARQVEGAALTGYAATTPW